MRTAPPASADTVPGNSGPKRCRLPMTDSNDTGVPMRHSALPDTLPMLDLAQFDAVGAERDAFLARLRLAARRFCVRRCIAWFRRRPSMNGCRSRSSLAPNWTRWCRYIRCRPRFLLKRSARRRERSRQSVAARRWLELLKRPSAIALRCRRALLCGSALAVSHRCDTRVFQ